MYGLERVEMNEHFDLFSTEGERHFAHEIVKLTVEWGEKTIKKMRNTRLYANKRRKVLGGSQLLGGKRSLPVPCVRCGHH